MIPHHVPLVIKSSHLVCHWNDLARVPAFLPTDPHLISWNPKNRSRRRDGRVVVSVALDFGVVGNLRKAAGNETAESVVVGVFVWE